MKINYKEGESIDDYKVDILIPEQYITELKIIAHLIFYIRKIIAKILIGRDFNFDKISYTGKTLITKRIYESFTDYKTIFINGLEFYKLNDHMLRINYLITNGN